LEIFAACQVSPIDKSHQSGAATLRHRATLVPHFDKEERHSMIQLWK
jgi:hypothetical protein